MPDIPPLPINVISPIITRALDEDFGVGGDATANFLIPAKDVGTLYFRSREAGILAGMQAAQMTYQLVDPSVEFSAVLSDGAAVKKGELIAKVTGPVRALLMAERTALNFLGRMSGIATLTARYVAKTKDGQARIAATRKTTPGLRALEKRAVLAGGGFAHRLSLSDAIMIKDNHIAMAGGIENALTSVMARADHMMVVSVEVDSLEQLSRALPFNPNVILLDNMKPAQLKKAVAITGNYAGPRPVLEASGGVNLDTVAKIARSGVDVISIGALTHSAPNFDIGLDDS